MESAFQSGFASASLQVLLDKFATFALREIGLIWGVDDELDKLERTMLKIQALLDDMEVKNITIKAWQVWVQELKHLSHEADDLLDDVSMELLKLNDEESADIRSKNQVRDQVLSSFKFNLPHKINELQEKLDNVMKEMDSPLMTNLANTRQTKILRRHTSSLVDESSVIGRDSDKEKIIGMLCDEREEHSISIIPIIGIGGVGKTTLVQIVYNDSRIVETFELRIWASLSFELDAVNITKLLLESITGEVCKLLDLNLMQTRLRMLLSEKKFLIVLDDMWNDNSTIWDIWVLPFLTGARGSKILVTTRNMFVPGIVAASPFYCLEPLSDEDCWTIIKHKAFLNKNFVQQEILEVVGRDIAKKCKGLPLAAKTLGSLLYFKSEEMEWDALLKSELWDLSEQKSEVFPALKLSYDYLPAHLKKCFAYFSNFAMNYEFEKEELVLLWISEGLVQPRSRQRIEDIGAEYFDDLVWRSLLSRSSRSTYQMHNLIHNLAHLVSKDINFSMEKEMSSLLPLFKPEYSSPMSTSVPHMFVMYQRKYSKAIKVSKKFKNLRSIMLNNYGSSIVHVPEMFLVELQSLRVLDLSCTEILKLPNSIGSLRHLRYLNASRTNISTLPDSISKLYWLQIIKLKGCRKFVCLPMCTKSLTNLRHLDLNILQLISMPPQVGKLTNLQGLSAFIVGKKSGYRVEELMNMRNLRGSLSITNLENVTTVTEACKAQLGNKAYIEKLELEWKSTGDLTVEQQVLAGMQPHNNLKGLHIKGYKGFMFPEWLGDQSFSKLEYVKLYNCHNCKLFPGLGGLPNLKFLDIHKMNSLENLFVGSYNRACQTPQFPSLESLKIHHMPMLQKWEGLQYLDMPKLQRLSIEYCPNLFALPSLRHIMSLATLCIIRCSNLQSVPSDGLPDSLKELIISDCAILKERCMGEEGEDWNKIRMIPYIEIDYVKIQDLQPRSEAMILDDI